MKFVRKIWVGYLSVGSALGVVKMLSAVTWTAWHSFAALPTVNGYEVSQMGGLFMGVFGAALSVFAWPLSVYQWFSGSVPLAEILFHPWINAGYD